MTVSSAPLEITGRELRAPTVTYASQQLVRLVLNCQPAGLYFFLGCPRRRMERPEPTFSTTREDPRMGRRMLRLQQPGSRRDKQPNAQSRAKLDEIR